MKKIVFVIIAVSLIFASCEKKALEGDKNDMVITSGDYVCPMHADVTSDKPGTCSKCGMELVKKEVK